ncbi:unnamed protein product [Sphagnum troendelagicum]
MSAKLHVSRLRKELSKSGLDTSGLKPALVARLDEAIAKEEADKARQVQVQIASDADNTQASGSDAIANNPKIDGTREEKRKRTPDDDDAAAACDRDDDVKPLKFIKVEEVGKMGVSQLRAALSDRGIVATTGAKKAALVDQLTAVLDKDLAKQQQRNGKDMDSNLERGKEVVVKKRERALLDIHLPIHIQKDFHVLDHGGSDIYVAMLNQTNVGHNNNKFYLIQVLESHFKDKFYVYTRWGRVGVKGQDKLSGPYTSDNAVSEFTSKFYDKTKNEWVNRSNFEAYPNKYTWLEIDFEADKDDDGKVCYKTQEDNKMENQPVPKSLPQPCKLDMRVHEFISLICNIDMMQNMMTEIGYDARKMPLGKLSKSTILKGYEVLKRLASSLENPNYTERNGSLLQLSSEFYTIIPHDFGFQKMYNFVIDTPQKLKSKLQMVESLGEIELATKLLGNKDEYFDDMAYTHYKRLKCELEPLDADNAEHLMILQYVENTHAMTHDSYKLEVLEVFRVTRQGEEDCFETFGRSQNRMLLWHGSRLSNWTGILSQGLRIAPPEAPVSGYMFGKGVYFADMVSKSANYCCTSPRDPIGVLLLCEVALGDMQELFTGNFHADQLPSGKLSTKGVGRTAPDTKEYMTLPDGVTVPLGKPVQAGIEHASLLYNEYIVYNTAQIRMRYVLKVHFDYQRRRSRR